MWIAATGNFFWVQWGRPPCLERSVARYGKDSGTLRYIVEVHYKSLSDDRSADRFLCERAGTNDRPATRLWEERSGHTRSSSSSSSSSDVLSLL